MPDPTKHSGHDHTAHPDGPAHGRTHGQGMPATGGEGGAPSTVEDPMRAGQENHGGHGRGHGGGGRVVTGESEPVRRGAGDTVVAGTVATDTAIRVRVAAVGEDTALAGIQRLVAEAQSSTTHAQLLADRAAGRLFWFAIAAAAITAVVWTVYCTPEDALTRVVTVLVIACPHALGLAIPLVVSISTERAARGGVLVKDRGAMERMCAIDTVLFDKTGTLTRGEPAVNHIAGAGLDDDEVLALAAAADADSEHPWPARSSPPATAA